MPKLWNLLQMVLETLLMNGTREGDLWSWPPPAALRPAPLLPVPQPLFHPSGPEGETRACPGGPRALGDAGPGQSAGSPARCAGRRSAAHCPSAAPAAGRSPSTAVLPASCCHGDGQRGSGPHLPWLWCRQQGEELDDWQGWDLFLACLCSLHTHTHTHR